MRKKVAIPVVVLIWLVVGAIAAAQRGYYSQSDQDCDSIGTTLVTILVGPLNYIGVDPDVQCPGMPEPS
ncbi:MAG TPA: hypothetical protein VIL37_04015 [Natronosporangium sp.]